MASVQLRAFMVTMGLVLFVGGAWAVPQHRGPEQAEPGAPTPTTTLGAAAAAAVETVDTASASSTPPVVATSSTSTTTTVPAVVTTTTEPPTTTTTTRPPTTTTTRPPTTTTAPPAPTTTTTAPPAPTTTTTTTTEPGEQPPDSLPMSEGDIRALVQRYFPADQVELAVLVIRCESNNDAAAFNPSGYGGLFQHALSAWDSRAAAAGFPGAPWWHAEANIAAGWNLWKGAPPYDASWHWPYCYDWAESRLG